MRGLTREQLERAVARAGPFRPELLAEMSDEELAEAANSVGDFDELAANAREGGGGDAVEVKGILQDDPPPGDGETARNVRRASDQLLTAGASLNGGRALGGSVAVLNRREGDNRADNRDGGEVDVEVTGILSGRRGKAVADGAHARAENRGRKEAAEAGLRVTPIMSGPRGTAAVDED